MKALSTPVAILAGSIVIAAAIFLKPSPTAKYQALYGDGYIFVIDLQGKNIANIVPVKNTH